MMLKDRVAESIHKVYPTADTHLLAEDENGRVTGIVIDSSFSGQGPVLRTKVAWEQILKDLDSESVNVGLLLFLSPEEAP